MLKLFVQTMWFMVDNCLSSGSLEELTQIIHKFFYKIDVEGTFQLIL